MAIKYLRPVEVKATDYDKIKDAIIQAFKKEIYIPLIVELGLKKNTVKNARNDLLQAIQSGQITYYRGKFTGRFSSTLSRELRSIGAEWDRKQGAWKIPQSLLSIELRNAISLSASRFEQTCDKITAKLKTIIPEKIAGSIKIESIFDATLWKFEKEFEKNLQGIIIVPKLSAEQREAISKDYTRNMELFIKDWTEEEIVKLRKKVEKRSLDGNRYEGLVKTIQKSYGSSEKKAKFLARQETALFMENLKEVRYKDAGITHYKWSCVKMPKDSSPMQHEPGNIRYYHALNDQKIFSFEKGAVVNAQGDRKNPREDYNCRCTAIPIVKF